MDDEKEVTRRSLLGLGAKAAAPRWVRPFLESKRPYREAATMAANWLQSLEEHRGVCTVWPVTPGGDVRFDLYCGIAGVVLFQLALADAGQKDGLTRAMAGANALLEHVSYGEMRAGLYDGLLGIAWTLEEVYRASRAAVYRDHAKAVARTALAEPPKELDVVSGLSGCGMAALELSERFGDAKLMDAAVRWAEELAEIGPPWKIRSFHEVEMPNFAHGTAGVVTFLALVYRATGQERFLSAARHGGEYLQSLSVGENCLIPRKIGEHLFYSGWCHGPVGTARAFHALNLVERGKWKDWVKRCARAVIENKEFTDWENYGACCGTAAKVSFFVDLFQVSGSKKWLSAAKTYADKLLRAAVKDEDRLCWPHAEHRVQPRNIAAQTGLMQGAAGIGVALLQLDAALHGDALVITLPDNPFRRVS